MNRWRCDIENQRNLWIGNHFIKGECLWNTILFCFFFGSLHIHIANRHNKSVFKNGLQIFEINIRNKTATKNANTKFFH